MTELHGHITEEQERDLDYLSIKAQAIGQKCQSLYDSTDDDDDAIAAVEKLQQSGELLQRGTGEARTKIFEGAIVDLQLARTKVDDEIEKLNKIVKAIEKINEILEIATQIAQIAAGLMV